MPKLCYYVNNGLDKSCFAKTNYIITMLNIFLSFEKLGKNFNAFIEVCIYVLWIYMCTHTNIYLSADTETFMSCLSEIHFITFIY